MSEEEELRDKTFLLDSLRTKLKEIIGKIPQRLWLMVQLYFFLIVT